MKIAYILSIFYIGTVLGSPIKDVHLYEAIVHDCPEVRNDTNLKNVKLFDKCGNIKLTPPQQQEKFTKDDVLCLIFYNTFISYCSNTKNITTSLPTDIYSKYNMSTVCDNVAILTDLPQTTPANQQLAYLKKMLDTKEKCVEICNSEELMLQIEPVCSVSYYYGHLIETKTPIIEKKIKIVTNPPNNGENHQETASVKHDNTINKTQMENHQQTTSVKPHSPQQDQTQKIQNSPTKPIKKPTSTTSEQNNQVKPPAPSGENDIPNTSNQETPPISGGAKDKQISLNQEETPVASGEIKQSSTEKVITTEITATKLSVVADNDVVENTAAETGGQQQQQPPQNSDLEMEQPNEHFDSDEDIDIVDDQNPKEPPASKANNNNNNKPNTVDESEAAVDYPTEMDGDSYFFSYFMMLCIIFIVGYICYHNKQKILALILEGRRGKRQYRSRRPNSANYHKLDSNLEEAITSSCNKNTTNVIY